MLPVATPLQRFASPPLAPPVRRATSLSPRAPARTDADYQALQAAAEEDIDAAATDTQTLAEELGI
jgi:hypothetical protein